MNDFKMSNFAKGIADTRLNRSIFILNSNINVATSLFSNNNIYLLFCTADDVFQWIHHRSPNHNFDERISNLLEVLETPRNTKKLKQTAQVATPSRTTSQPDVYSYSSSFCYVIPVSLKPHFRFSSSRSDWFSHPANSKYVVTGSLFFYLKCEH